MCGIVGYIGKKDASKVLLEGLKRLEYRGYDSAGISVICDGNIHTRKRKGKITELIREINQKKLPSSSVGIAHTRWATHGAPTNANAHPHQDFAKRISVVHNGIIENFQELKDKLIKEGFVFRSQTDTEVAAYLIGKYYKNNLEDAARKALREIKGTYALSIISKDEPGKIVVARFASPLVVGVGRGENFVASDVPAIIPFTKRVIYLNDEELASITKDKVKVFGMNGRPRRFKIDKVKWDISQAEKKGFPHFMLKEIFEQPEVTRSILHSRIKNHSVHLEGTNIPVKALKNIDLIIVVACGTAYHAGLVGEYIIEDLSKIPVYVDLSSEFRYRNPMITKNTLVIAVSQSGETADTLAAAQEAKNKGAKILSICNVVGSSLSRQSDGILYTHAGPEIGVASTKAYTAQILMFYLFAIYFAKVRGCIDKKRQNKLIAELRRLPHLQNKILKTKDKISKVAQRHHQFGCFLYLGRNLNYPNALEGALKLKEISYIPAEGYAAGEMKHGPIALIDEYRAVVCIAPKDMIYEKMISNIQEIKARKGKIIVIATEKDLSIKKHAREIIYIPKIGQLFTPFLVIMPLQLLAYYIAAKRGCDVDQPRNLAKSVTVE